MNSLIFRWFEVLLVALLPIIIRTGLTYLRKVREGTVQWFDGAFLLTAAIAAFLNWMIAGRLLLPTTILPTGITEVEAIGVSMLLFIMGYWINDLLNKYITVKVGEERHATT